MKLFGKFGRIRLERNAAFYRHRGFVFTTRVRKGAGTIGGRTLFVAYHSGSKRWRDNFNGGGRSFLAGNRWPWEHVQIGQLEFGFTQNANAVPYTSH